MIEITTVTGDRRAYMPLLLMADEQESMVGRYLSRGELFAATDGGRTCAVCLVTREDDATLEIKNIAVAPPWRGRGIGRMMIEHLERHYAGRCRTLTVGTGDSPATVPFYERCGFVYSHRIPDFFTLNYDHPIVEQGVLLRDMIYMKKEIGAEPRITELTEFDPSATEAVNRLLGQLTDSHIIADDDLRRIIGDPASHLFLLHADGRIAGMLTLAVYTAPTGTKCWIEDVVVDDAMRGRSFGRRLVEHAIAYARGLAPATVMLTSRPSRAAANALYRSAGFQPKPTNVYTLKL